MKDSLSIEPRRRLNNKHKLRPQRATTEPGLTHSLWRSPPKFRKFSFSFMHASKSLPHHGGFCKGASLMQTGNRGMELINQSVSMTGQSIYWSCGNQLCCYEGPPLQARDEERKITWGFDDTLREMYGVRYRWSFLAKSHTEIGNSKKGFEYQCVFCAGQSQPCKRVKGEATFIKHFSSHQGQRPDKFKMRLINYIVGRTALKEEIFDVNLAEPLFPPVSAVETEADTSSGLGIQVDGDGESVHSMNVNIMMRAGDSIEWRSRQRQSQQGVASDIQSSDRDQKSPYQFYMYPSNPSGPTVSGSSTDLDPTPLFSSSVSAESHQPVITSPPSNAKYERSMVSEQPSPNAKLDSLQPSATGDLRSQVPLSSLPAPSPATATVTIHPDYGNHPMF